MSAKYKLVKRKDFSKDAPEDAVKYFAQLVNSGTVGFEELCEGIAEETALTSADVKSCLDRLPRHIARHAKEGRTVQVGELGTFPPHRGQQGRRHRRRVRRRHDDEEAVRLIPSRQGDTSCPQRDDLHPRKERQHDKRRRGRPPRNRIGEPLEWPFRGLPQRCSDTPPQNLGTHLPQISGHICGRCQNTTPARSRHTAAAHIGVHYLQLHDQHINKL